MISLSVDFISHEYRKMKASVMALSPSYKARLLSFYVTIVVIGVILILKATYQASRDLELVHEIDNLYSLHESFASKLPARAFDSESASEESDAKSFWMIPVDADRIAESPVKPCGQALSLSLLEKTRINPKGGVIEDGSCRFTWAMATDHKNQNRHLLLHAYRYTRMESLLAVYSNRLVIPVMFVIWMTVWGSMILANLVNRLHKQSEAVRHMAMHDALTGLPNRNMFSVRLSELCSYSSREQLPFALALIDLDKFKQVNDNYGHQSGDELLRQVAGRFREAIREYDMVARLGGDEFILLLPDTRTEDSRVIIERIYTHLIGEYTISGQSVNIGASIGVAFYPEHGEKKAELSYKADCAMYVAKESGGGIKFYSPTMVNSEGAINVIEQRQV